MDYLTEGPLRALFLDFQVAKLPTAEALWVAPEFSEIDHADDEVRRARFADMFGYMIPGGECTDSLHLDIRRARYMRAERYGGLGVADNGGGVRCGNIGRYQVKGIGRNPLVGSSIDLRHSYGGLSAVDAIYETIHAQVLNKVMPIGTAAVHGVILTGPEAAYEFGAEQTRGWGALMVRDAVLRPAHFLRAGNYRPTRELETQMVSDVGRTRIVNRYLLRRHGDVAGIVELLRTFLRRCANQFAFARMARIKHGTISPSNLCFDGRWIDLSVTQFLPSDQNNAGFCSWLPAFYEEAGAPLAILEQVLYNVNKFNGTKLDIAEFASFYNAQFNACLLLHVGFVLAFRPHQLTDDVIRVHLNYLKDDLSALLSSGKVVRNNFARELPTGDPMLSFLEHAYLTAASDTVDGRYFANAKPALRDHMRTAASIVAVFDELWCVSEGYSSRRYFLLAYFITAFKRAALPEYYYPGQLGAAIQCRIDGHEPQTIREFIDTSIALADWGFAFPVQNKTVIFAHKRAEILFDGATGIYTLSDSRSRIDFSSAEKLLEHLESCAPDVWHIEGFDFSPYLIRLLKTCAEIEKLTAGTYDNR